MENNKKRFCYKKFATFNAETKKFTCLVENCKKELSAACNSNLKRHYKLVHNILIDIVEMLPRCIKKNCVTKLNSILDKEEFLKCCIELVTKKISVSFFFMTMSFLKKFLNHTKINLKQH